MTLKIVERQPLIVVGMEIVTQPMSPEIPALWPKFVARIDEIENANEPKVSYGVMRNEASMQVLHYMAGVAVSSPGRVPDGMTSQLVPAGTYASFRYPLSGLARGFGEIFNRLLPSSNYVRIDAPHFERYDEAFDPRNRSSEVEIGIAVRLRA